MAKVEKRRVVDSLWKEGVRSAKKLAELSGLALSGVYRVLKRIKDGTGMEHSAGGGRPKKLGTQQRKSLLNIGRLNPRLGFRKIAGRFNQKNAVTIAPDTARRYLHAGGYRMWTPFPVPQMTPTQVQKRMERARELLTSALDRTFYTDESAFQLGSTSCKVLAKTKPRRPVNKFPPRIMVWGGISCRGATPLKVIHGTVNSEVYVDVLQEVLIPTADVLYPEGWVLQQDNARCHVSVYTRSWLAECGIGAPPWPAASPDLNPIENVWGLMKRYVDRASPRTIHELEKVVLRAWEVITAEHGTSLAEGVPRRLRRCIELQGDCVSKGVPRN